MQDLLQRPGVRLLTLTGPGGFGKTRLALAVAEVLPQELAEEVWLVELAPLADPGLVPHAVAAALGLREEHGSPMLKILVARLQARPSLVILDNCEHLVQACAALAEALLLSGAAHPGHQPRTAQGGGRDDLACAVARAPEPVDGRAVDETARSEAGRLFLERAQAALPEFALTERTARAVADVCRRLDGIPLALELAAAWVRVLGVEQIVDAWTIAFDC